MKVGSDSKIIMDCPLTSATVHEDKNVYADSGYKAMAGEGKNQ